MKYWQSIVTNGASRRRIGNNITEEYDVRWKLSKLRDVWHEWNESVYDAHNHRVEKYL